jgi:polar amino acid transport system substrate-binding protein
MTSLYLFEVYPNNQYFRNPQITIFIEMKSIKTLAICTFFCFINSSSSQCQDTLRVGYYETAPFIYTSNNELKGVNIWLWENICKEKGINYQLVETPLEELVESLGNNEIDISIAPLTITEERSRTIDFSPPNFIAYSSILIPKTSATEKLLLAMGSFLNLGFFRAVGALFVVILIFGLLLWLFEKRKNKAEFGDGLKGVWDGIWWSAVTMTTVGYGDKSPKTLAGRFIALIWMFAGLMIISGFTAAITSSLTVSQLSWNYSEISNFKEKKLGTIGESATEKWLNNNFYNNLVTFKSIEEAISALSKGKIDAITYDDPALQHVIRNEENVGYEVLPILYNQQMYAFGLSEDLDPEITEKISNELLKLTESRDWEMLLSEYGLLNND